MSKGLLFVLFLPAILVPICVGFLFPWFSREHILFGVSVPQSSKKSEDARRFFKQYQQNFALTILIPTLLILYVFWRGSVFFAIKTLMLYIIFVLVAMFANHYFIYKKVLEVMKKSNWQGVKKQSVYS